MIKIGGNLIIDDDQNITVDGTIASPTITALVAADTALVAADAAIITAYGLADGVVTTAFTDADAVVTTAFTDADTVVTTAYTDADAVVTTAYTDADAVVTAAFGTADAAVTTAYTTADTTLSNLWNNRITPIEEKLTPGNSSIFSSSSTECTFLTHPSGGFLNSGFTAKMVAPYGTIMQLRSGGSSAVDGRANLLYFNHDNNRLANGMDQGGLLWYGQDFYNGSALLAGIDSMSLDSFEYNNVSGWRTGSNLTFSVSGYNNYGAGFSDAIDTMTIEHAFNGQGYVNPSTSSNANLGQGAKEWDDIYCVDLHESSDANFKEDVEECALGLDFLKDLNPVSYVWKDKQIEETFKDADTKRQTMTREKKHVRRHYGLIAQEVKEVLDTHNIEAKDFGGYVDSIYQERTESIDGIAPLANVDKGEYSDVESGERSFKSLRYRNFISILIKSVQELAQQVEELKNGN
tara:strand:- start:154 stop:1542 length:1389 start_codon:yes stop_codon:yes gene_type:complete